MRRFITLGGISAVIVCATIPILAATGGDPTTTGREHNQQPTLETLQTMQTLIDDGDYDAALAQSEAYLEQHADNRDARFLHAVALAGLDRNTEAIAAFKALAQDWPQRPEPANNLAALYARGGDYKKARTWLQKALNTQKVYAVAHRNLGDVYTALATMAYSRVLADGEQSSDQTGIQLALVNHMAAPQASPGLQLPVAAATVRAPQTTPVAATETPDAQAAPGNQKKAANAQAVPAESKADNSTHSSDDKRVLQAVSAWAKAWSSQDFAAYVDSYTPDYPRDGDSSREQWLAERKTRVVGKAAIEVDVISPEINPIDTDHVRVTFIQTYRSPSYSDKSRKWLLMQRTDDGWRIARETSTLLSRG